MSAAEPILQVESLRTHFVTRAGVVRAVEDVSFEIARGSIFGVVGESGSGKSALAASILRLVDAPGRIVSGRIVFAGRDLTQASETEMRQIRGASLCAIFQDPMTALDPVMRIGNQMVEAIRAHRHSSRRAAWAEARDALARVGISSPEERLRQYPHQLSGGMRQRVAIATAMLNRPQLIIADEPTTALDVTIQAQILFEMQRLCRETGTSLLWITHDFAVVAALADVICVMYRGAVVEQGPSDIILDRPRHPYTVGLMRSIPGRNARGRPLYHLKGAAKSVAEQGRGCVFRPRCARADERCEEEPPVVHAHDGHMVRCFHPYPEHAAAE